MNFALQKFIIMRNILFILSIVLIAVNGFSQSVGINNTLPHSSSVLDIKSSNKGILMPRTSSASRLSIPSPAKGLTVYDTTLLSYFVYNGASWVALTQSNSSWTLLGNSGTIASNFLGTIDKKNLRFKVNNQFVGYLDTLEGNIGFGINTLQTAGQFVNRNVAIGTAALNRLSVGDINIALGDSAMAKAVFGSGGIAIGVNAMRDAPTSNNNIAIGSAALLKVNNYNNIGIGTLALTNNVSGELNVGLGENAIANNVDGNRNIGIGAGAVFKISTGNGNIGLGTGAMGKTTSSNFQIAIGDSALYKQSTMTLFAPQLAIGTRALYSNDNPGGFGTAVGHYSQEKLTLSSNNTTLGHGTMRNVTAGSDNVVIGLNAMSNANNSSSNIAIGKNAMLSSSTANGNIAIGTSAMSDNVSDHSVAIGFESMKDNLTGNHVIAIGRAAAALAESESIAIGDSTLALSVGTLNVGIGSKILKKAIGQNNIGIGTSVMGNATNQGYITNNVGLGYFALYNTNFGSNNTAIGNQSMYSNIEGNNNIAIGESTLKYNTFGDGNIALGNESLLLNVDKNANVAIGDSALRVAIGDVTNGLNSVAIGRRSLYNTTTGYNNTALGVNTLINNITGKRITAIGANADVDIDSTNLTNATVIGNNATVGESNTMSFGNNNTLNWVFGRKKVANAGMAFQVGFNATNGNGANLTDGGVWTNASDINKKEDRQDLDGTNLINKIKQLEVQKWKYIGTNEYHIGPYAQQFKQLFDVGNDDTSISTIDPSGVALAAIKELLTIVENQQKQIDELKAKIK